jgi:phosphoribosylformylglycinamidine cyclo-ligase
VKPVLNLIRDFPIKGIVHITGGGFDGNVPRVLPKGVRARIDPAAGRGRPSSAGSQRVGEISETEMLRVFNCGIGMVLVVPPESTDDVLERLQGLGERAYRIGAVETPRRRRRAEGQAPSAPDDAAVRYVRARRTG